MGIEIDRHEFGPDEYARFSARLDASLDVLEELLARPGFGEGPPSIGAELEVSLVDDGGRPLPLNRQVLAESLDPRLTFELDRFNLESNLRHGPLAGTPFASLRRECEDALAEMQRAAGLHDARIAMIGILPTLEQADLESGVMTDSARYRALSESLRRLRREPFHLEIHGEDDLELHCHDVTYEGAATSLQLHLRTDPGRFAALYNAIQLATPPVLALAVNSPTFLGRRLWDETRVALFKQAVDHRPRRGRRGEAARVTFGDGWIREPLELFAENVANHEPLLPLLGDEDPHAVLAAGRTPALHELRLHQGTVWRWNRAIYDPAEGGHLRIEMRALPSGPTVVDMLANAALLIGLALDLMPEIDAWTAALPFDSVHRDFYRAAREGVDARIAWPPEPGGPLERRTVRELVPRLLPRAAAGLARAGVVPEDSDPLLAVVARRAETGCTGASWQRRALADAEATRPRSEALAFAFAGYLERSAAGEPVGDWSELAA